METSLSVTSIVKDMLSHVENPVDVKKLHFMVTKNMKKTASPILPCLPSTKISMGIVMMLFYIYYLHDTLSPRKAFFIIFNFSVVLFSVGQITASKSHHEISSISMENGSSSQVSQRKRRLDRHKSTFGWTLLISEWLASAPFPRKIQCCGN